jgi:hypothetical protein
VEKALPIPRRRTGAIAFPGCAHEGLLQQCGVHLLLADRIAGSVGGPDRYWNSLASVAWVPGGNLHARYGRGLFCECIQKPDLSLCAHRAALSGGGDSAALIGLHAHQAHGDMDRYFRGDRNGALAGVALCAKAIRCCLRFLIYAFSGHSSKRHLESHRDAAPGVLRTLKRAGNATAGSEAHLGAAEIGQIVLGGTSFEIDFKIHGGEVGGGTALEEGLPLFR